MSEETKFEEQMASASAADKEAAAESSTQESSTTPESEIDLSNVTTLKKGSIVTGKVVKVEQDEAIVDVGYKYDGIINIRELSSVQLDNAADAVQVGQEVTLKVISINDNKERLELSKKAIDSEKAWDDLQQKMESKEIIEAKVSDVVKGGLVVDVGLRGFVPASMVERHFVEDFGGYKGRDLRLRVKELDREKNKVILSQKDVLDDEFEANKKQILSGLSVGQELDGTVQRLTQFGAFVDIGGIDGLVHISEMAWHHVDKPGDVVKEGDSVRVKILKMDPANERVSLSIKAAQPGPWDRVGNEFQDGQIVTGTVKRLVAFGAFVEIAPGVEGLVHISQIAHRHIGTPHEVLKEGQEVQVKILEINPAEKRVSLSIKETEEAPEQPAREERRPRGNRREEHVVIPEAQGLNLTLGERFGDKLKKFK